MTNDELDELVKRLLEANDNDGDVVPLLRDAAKTIMALREHIKDPTQVPIPRQMSAALRATADQIDRWLTTIRDAR